MSVSESEVAPSRKSVINGQLLVFAVPAVATIGCAYLFGYFSTVGLFYFTFLDLQDFLNAAAMSIPAIAIYGVFIDASYLYSVHKEADILHEASLDEEALTEHKAKRERAARHNDPTSILFDYKKGEWNVDRIFIFKFFTVPVFGVFFISFVLILNGLQIPLWVLWPFLIALIYLTGTLMMYFDERYGTRPDRTLIATVICVLLFFASGVTVGRIDQSNSSENYRLILQDSVEAKAAVIRRVGQNTLIKKSDQKAWVLIPQAQIVSVERVRGKKPAGNQPKSAK